MNEISIDQEMSLLRTSLKRNARRMLHMLQAFEEFGVEPMDSEYEMIRALSAFYKTVPTIVGTNPKVDSSEHADNVQTINLPM